MQFIPTNKITVGQWTWGLELTGYGAMTKLAASSSITHEGGKITCQRDENLTEWFINDTRGLEQGWTLQHRPQRADPSAPLRLDLSTRGNLRQQIVAGGSGVSFRRENSDSALTYTGLKAWDADGKTLIVRFEATDEEHFSIAVSDQAARYPITIDPVARQAYLKASVSSPNANFGYSVAIHGDTAVVGAPFERLVGHTSIGAIYVFKRDAGTWTQQARLILPFPSSLGVSVGIWNDTIVAGSGDAATVFKRSDATWSKETTLLASNYTVNYNYSFGDSVAISEDTIVVGAPTEPGSSSGVNGDQGSDGSTPSAGAVYVFKKNGSWDQVAYLKPHTTSHSTYFGTSVAISGSTILVGAPGDAGINSAAYVFQETSGSWAEQASFIRSSHTQFGRSVSIDGDTGVVGDYAYDNLYGAAFVFQRVSTTWSEKATLRGFDEGRFGYSVSVNNNIIVVGAPEPPPSTFSLYSGGVHIFERADGIWQRQKHLRPYNTGLPGNFGYAVAVSGATLVAGNPEESSNATGVDGNENDTSSQSSGAAYIYSGITVRSPSERFADTVAASGLIGPDAEAAVAPFNDGTVNLLKYAFNMTLNAPDHQILESATGVSGLPVIGLVGSGPATMIRVEFLRRKGSGLVYTPKLSTTLDPASFLPMSGIPVVTSIDDIWERVVVEDPADPASRPRLFAQVSVSLP